MQGQRSIWVAAGLIALLAVALLTWALLPRGSTTHGRRPVAAINPALNLRYRYDSTVFVPAPFDANAEFALQLNAKTPDGKPRFALYGKRILGIGSLLGKAPGPLLYDFVGSQYAQEFEDNYGLVPLGEPRYEDLQLHGGLGLYQLLRYSRPAGRRWPGWFPPSLGEVSEATIEGWVFFHGADLYYFYAVSAAPLDEAQRRPCLDVVESLEFNYSAPAAADGAEPKAEANPDGAEEDGNASAPNTKGQGGKAPKPPPGKGLIGGG